MSARESAPITIVLAGGGSGGHLSPGLAVAEAFDAAHRPMRARFLCSSRSIDATILGRAGVDFTPIPAAPGRSVRSITAFFGAMRRSRRALRAFDVAVVVSLGGFVSLPVAFAAWRLRIPVLLLNLDVAAGRANRMVARLATRVLSAVPVRNLPLAPESIVGMPIRRAAIAGADAATCREQLSLAPNLDTLLVTGASQGSSSLNDAVPAIAAQARERFRNWQVLHLAGALDESALDAIRERYAACGIPARVIPFLHEMGTAWGAATLAVTRGGASSVAEAAANAVPAVFVPFPHHHDQHQRLNALPLVERGAARVAIDPILPHGVDPPLSQVLPETLADAAFLASARESLRSMPSAQAAQRVVAAIEALIPPRTGR